MFESNKVYRTEIGLINNSHFLSFLTTIPPNDSNILLFGVIIFIHRKEVNDNPILGRLIVVNITA